MGAFGAASSGFGVAMSLDDADVDYLISRLRSVVELLKEGEIHMAVAKLNADIAALSVPESQEEQE